MHESRCQTETAYYIKLTPASPKCTNHAVSQKQPATLYYIGTYAWRTPPVSPTRNEEAAHIHILEAGASQGNCLAKSLYDTKPTTQHAKPQPDHTRPACVARSSAQLLHSRPQHTPSTPHLRNSSRNHLSCPGTAYQACNAGPTAAPHCQQSAPSPHEPACTRADTT
jgi:hypothetical protein